MKKRKLIAILAAVVLLAMIGVGATLAYFTNGTDYSNVVTMGHVDISLTENTVTFADGAWIQNTGTEDITETGLTFTDVLPSMTVPKNPTVALREDSEDAYVRLTMNLVKEAGSGISDADLAVLAADLDGQILSEGSGWNKGDGGYYYYGEKLDSEHAVAVFFETVTIPPSWGNNTAGQGFQIVLQAEAIQADHFEPERDGEGNVLGRFDGEGNAITAESYVEP
ncbi:MAG: hypothetical protein HFI64_02560 [Lachnospiraceae bacterium]|nr:hypothetical protein [Lachnospiraceae bacterium]